MSAERPAACLCAVLCGVSADVAWQMEEVLAEEPDLNLRANCVALLPVKHSRCHWCCAMECPVVCALVVW
jgi:hypothetical protein